MTWGVKPAELHATAVSACTFVDGANQAALTADMRGGLVLHNVSAYASIMGAPCMLELQQHTCRTPAAAAMPMCVVRHLQAA